MLGLGMANVVAAAQGAKAAEVAAAARAKDSLLGSRLGARLMWRKAAAQIKIDCSSTKPKLVDQAPKWWAQPEQSIAAAHSFDRSYRTASARAESLFYRLEHHHSVREDDDNTFWTALYDTSRLRFLPPDRLRPLQHSHGSWQRRAVRPSTGMADTIGDAEPAFDLMRSIWAPRAKWADSRSLYDTDECLAERFTNDWNRALELGIVNMVMKYDDDAAADDDGDGVPDEYGIGVANEPVRGRAAPYRRRALIHA